MHEAFLAVWLLLISLPVQGVECLPKSYHDLSKQYVHKKMTLVFFASWCTECSASLEKKRGQENTLFISVFDEKDRADAVAKKFQLPNCILDTDLVSRWNIKGVPFSKVVEF